MTDGILAEARDYGQLIDAFRARAADFGTTMEVIDEVAGLPLRYTSKLFAPVPIKSVGKVSLGPILGALGLKLLVAVDEEMFERIRHRLTPRRNTRGKIRATPGRKRSALLGDTEWGKVMHARWMLATTPRQRKRFARQAIASRWSKAAR